MVLLEKENKALSAAMKKYKIAQPQFPAAEEGRKARFTSRGILALTKKLRHSQADFGKLLGTTPGAIHLWEKKKGPLNLRDKTKAAILSIGGLGPREAKGKLAELGKKLKKGRSVVSKKRKRS